MNRTEARDGGSTHYRSESCPIIFEPYSGTPLLKKLGIKPNSSIALLDAPTDSPIRLAHCPKA